MKRALISMVAGAATLLASLPVMAGDPVASPSSVAKVQSAQVAARGPLAPAGAAGVRQAQGIDDVPLIWLVGAAAVLTLGIIAFSNNNNNNNPTTPATPSTPASTGT